MYRENVCLGNQLRPPSLSDDVRLGTKSDIIGNTRKFVGIRGKDFYLPTSLLSNGGREVRRTPQFHAFILTDTVSCFNNRRERTAWNTWLHGRRCVGGQGDIPPTF